jgi:hypothetical protein
MMFIVYNSLQNFFRKKIKNNNSKFSSSSSRGC